MSDTTVRFRFLNDHFVATSHETGRITVIQNGKVIINNDLAQAGKTMIAAIHELFNAQYELLNQLMDGRTEFEVSTELPLNVDIENGKYTFKCNQAGSQKIINAHIDRYGQYWIDTDDLKHKKFWIALAGALHNARRKIA